VPFGAFVELDAGRLMIGVRFQLRLVFFVLEDSRSLKTRFINSLEETIGLLLRILSREKGNISEGSINR
jgi:hypothetical protein